MKVHGYAFRVGQDVFFNGHIHRSDRVILEKIFDDIASQRFDQMPWFCRSQLLDIKGDCVVIDRVFNLIIQTFEPTDRHHPKSRMKQLLVRPFIIGYADVGGDLKAADLDGIGCHAGMS